MLMNLMSLLKFFSGSIFVLSERIGFTEIWAEREDMNRPSLSAQFLESVDHNGTIFAHDTCHAI